MNLKVFVVDDEPDTIELVCTFLNENCDIEIAGTANNAADALKAIRKSNPDLVLCDIQMPGQSGLELARQIRSVNDKIQVIFLTAFDHYAIEAIKLEALDYILKPVDPDELGQAIQKVIKRSRDLSLSGDVKTLLNEIRKSDKLRFNNMNGFVLLRASEIFYAEADGNYCKLILVDGHIEVTSQNLLCIEKKLDPFGFIRLSRSHLINPAYIAGIDRKKKLCLLKHDETRVNIPIPADRVREISELIQPS
jgi:two-component system, LytTR family, response regulator